MCSLKSFLWITGIYSIILVVTLTFLDIITLIGINAPNLIECDSSDFDSIDDTFINGEKILFKLSEPAALKIDINDQNLIKFLNENHQISKLRKLENDNDENNFNKNDFLNGKKKLDNENDEDGFEDDDNDLTPKEDTPKENTPKEDIPKEDIPKDDNLDKKENPKADKKEEKPEEEKPEEEKPEEEKPKEEKPKEKKPEEEKPKEEKPEEEKPKKELPEEEKPKKELPEEEKPEEEKPKKELPKEEKPKEEKPKEEKPKEEKPKEEKPKEDEPKKEKPKEEKPKKDKPKEEDEKHHHNLPKPVRELNWRKVLKKSWNEFLGGLNRHERKPIYNSLICVKLLFRLLTMIALPLFIIGNHKNKATYLKPFKILTFLLFLYNIVITVFYQIVNTNYDFYKNLANLIEKHFTEPTKETGTDISKLYMVLTFVDLFPIFALITMILIKNREKQIINKKDHTTQENWDMQLRPMGIPRLKNEPLSPINLHFNQPSNHSLIHDNLPMTAGLITNEEISVNNQPFSYTSGNQSNQALSYYDNHAFSKN